MRYTGPTGKGFYGDKAKAVSYMGTARLLVGRLMQRLKAPPFSGRGHLVDRQRMDDGSWVHVLVSMQHGIVPVVRTWVESPIAGGAASVSVTPILASIAFVPALITDFSQIVESDLLVPTLQDKFNLSWNSFSPNNVAIGDSFSSGGELQYGNVFYWGQENPDTCAWIATRANPLEFNAGVPNNFGNSFWVGKDVRLGRRGIENASVLSWHAPHSRCFFLGEDFVGPTEHYSTFLKTMSSSFSNKLYHKQTVLVEYPITVTGDATIYPYAVGAGIDVEDLLLHHGWLFVTTYTLGVPDIELVIIRHRLRINGSGDAYEIDSYEGAFSVNFNALDTIEGYVEGENRVSNILSGPYFNASGTEAVMSIATVYGYNNPVGAGYVLKYVPREYSLVAIPTSPRNEFYGDTVEWESECTISAPSSNMDAIHLGTNGTRTDTRQGYSYPKVPCLLYADYVGDALCELWVETGGIYYDDVVTTSGTATASPAGQSTSYSSSFTTTNSENRRTVRGANRVYSPQCGFSFALDDQHYQEKLVGSGYWFYSINLNPSTLESTVSSGGGTSANKMYQRCTSSLLYADLRTNSILVLTVNKDDSGANSTELVSGAIPPRHSCYSTYIPTPSTNTTTGRAVLRGWLCGDTYEKTLHSSSDPSFLDYMLSYSTQSVNAEVHFRVYPSAAIGHISNVTPIIHRVLFAGSFSNDKYKIYSVSILNNVTGEITLLENFFAGKQVRAKIGAGSDSYVLGSMSVI